MIYGIIDINGKKLTFSRAGHNSLLKLGINGCHEFYTPSGIGLGLDSGDLFEKQLEEVTFRVENEDTLIFYTDGVTEAMNQQLEEFGEERLLKSLKSSDRGDAAKIRQRILKSIKMFIGDALHTMISLWWL